MKISQLFQGADVSVVLILLLISSSSSFAHHSQALFDTSKVITFEGTVSRLDWKNPHIYLIVETVDESDKTILQEIEGLAITQARVDGLDRDALKAGTRVIVRANPNLRGSGKTVRGLTVATLDGKVHPFYERSGQARILEPAESLSGKWAPPLSETGKVFGVVASTWKFKEVAVSDNSKGVCEIEPVPFLTMINELRVIEVKEDTVIMRHDNSGDIGVRTVYLDQPKHPANLAPSLFGHSIGHWEDKTLVIDTVAYAPHHAGVFDRVKSGERKHTVERLTLSEDGRQLHYQFTMEDPDNLVAPVSFSMMWDHRPDLNISTEPCDPDVAERYLKY